MLLRVPDEILAHIFSIIECDHVEGGWDPKPSYSTLLSLSRVCKRFRGIAEFYLYRSIFLLEKDTEEKWLQFARGLQRDPKRGLTTRKFCAQTYDPVAPLSFLRFLTKYFLKFSLSPDRDRIPPGLRSAIQCELEFTIYKRQYISLRVLLLLLMPDLRHLDLTIPDMESTSFLLNGTFESDEDHGNYGFETNEGGPGYEGIPNIFFFRHLETVTLRTSNKLGSQRAISGILSHPGVNVLRLDGFALLYCACQRLYWNRGPSNLARLDLENCILHPTSLKCILEKCRNLTHLNMALKGYGDLKNPTHNFEELGIVLREHGRNLVELSITKAMRDPHIADPVNFIGSLKELTVLKHLSIGRLNFVGPIDDETKKDITMHDKLPQSLETLTIEAEVTDCPCDLHRIRQTEELVCSMVKHEQLPPGLKQIHMKMPPGPEARGYELVEAAELGGWQIRKKGLWVRRIRDEEEMYRQELVGVYNEFGVLRFITSATQAQ